MRAGAVPIDGVVTETRVALKVILRGYSNPSREFLVAGGEWSTSDYGNGVAFVSGLRDSRRLPLMLSFA